MKYSIDDVVEEVRDNFRALLSEYSEKGKRSLALESISGGTLIFESGPDAIQMKASVDTGTATLHAEYIGFQHEPLSRQVPTDDDGNFALNPGTELFEVCQEMFDLLAHA